MKKRICRALSCAKKGMFHAFSLVELMVTLVVVACITAAMTPIITKRLKSKDVTVMNGGGNVEFATCPDEMTAKGCAFCAAEDKCALCAISCDGDEYVDTPECVCEPCTNKDPKCVACGAKSCNKCDIGYGLVALNKTCAKCAEGKYSNGEIPCTVCPENYICSGDDTAPIACAADKWSNEGSTTCNSCTEILANCGKCNPRECLECRKGYKLKEKNGALYCALASGNAKFTTAGEHTFTVPESVEEINMFLVGGGAGGGGGAHKEKTASFVISGNAGITADDDNKVYTNANGIFNWTIPTTIKGKEVKITACGGGGQNSTKNGGNGGAIANASFTIPSSFTTLPIKVGGWGGSGISGVGTGYDPIYTNANVGGGAAGTGGNVGGAGSYINGGAGGARSSCVWTSYCGAATGTDDDPYCRETKYGTVGGKGGSATLIYHYDYAKVASLVAPGGGGGGGNTNTSGCTAKGGSGGGGGGVGGGKGGNVGSAGSDGTGSGNASAAFGTSYCSRQKNGAMRIFYSEPTNGGSGGGGGMMARSKIAVSEGQVLTIIVGAGGAGGLVNTSGAAGEISQVLRDGEVLIKTLGTNATGGNSDGTTAGAAGSVTSGVTSAEASINYVVTNPDTGVATQYTFATLAGGTTTETTGAAGGQTTIYSKETFCTAGKGGVSGNDGGDASGYGGCGGGGAGGGGTGGGGAPGYVYFVWGEE